MKLGEFIKKKRQEQGLTLRELAKRVDLSHSYISQIENGFDPRSGKPITPTIDTIEKLSIGLGLSFKEVLVELGYLKVSDKVEDIIEREPNIRTKVLEKDGQEVKILEAANNTGLTADEIAEYLNNLSKYIKKQHNWC